MAGAGSTHAEAPRSAHTSDFSEHIVLIISESSLVLESQPPPSLQVAMASLGEEEAGSVGARWVRQLPHRGERSGGARCLGPAEALGPGEPTSNWPSGAACRHPLSTCRCRALPTGSPCQQGSEKRTRPRQRRGTASKRAVPRCGGEGGRPSRGLAVKKSIEAVIAGMIKAGNGPAGSIDPTLEAANHKPF